MTDTNVIALTGRLVKSMEVIHTQNQYAIGNFTLAVNRARKDKDGKWADRASFIDCSLLGNSVDNLSSYLIKGKQVSIQGYLEQDRWEKDGQKFSRIRVVITNLVLIGGQKPQTDDTPPQVPYSNNGAEGEYYTPDENSKEEYPF